MTTSETFRTGSRDHYTKRYFPKKPFFSTTESRSLPFLYLPPPNKLRELRINARILSITGSGQILDVAALNERSGILESLTLVDYNPSQNVFVAYLCTQAVLAQETGELVRTRVISATAPEIQEILATRMFELFPELEGYPTLLPDGLFGQLAKKFVCVDAKGMEIGKRDDWFTFNTHNFRYYFLDREDLARSLVSMVKSGKVRFHLGPIEEFRTPKAGRFHLIYASDVHPHMKGVELEKLIDMIERSLHPKGMCLVSGFGTDCMSIATGEARREEELFAVLHKRLLLCEVADYHDWGSENERNLKAELGFDDKSSDDWYSFLRAGPYGLKPKQHLPILLVKPDVMVQLFMSYVKDYDWTEEKIKQITI